MSRGAGSADGFHLGRHFCQVAYHIIECDPVDVLRQFGIALCADVAWHQGYRQVGQTESDAGRTGLS